MYEFRVLKCYITENNQLDKSHKVCLIHKNANNQPDTNKVTLHSIKEAELHRSVLQAQTPMSSPHFAESVHTQSGSGCPGVQNLTT